MTLEISYNFYTWYVTTSMFLDENIMASIVLNFLVIFLF